MGGGVCGRGVRSAPFLFIRLPQYIISNAKEEKILQSLDAFLFIVISTSFDTFSTRRCTFVAVLHRFPAAVTSGVAPFSFIRLRGRRKGLWAGGYVVRHYLATIHHF